MRKSVREIVLTTRPTEVALAEDLGEYVARAVTSPHDVAAVMRGAGFVDAPAERLVVFHLDNRGRCVGFEVVAHGGSNTVYASPVDVLRGAIVGGAVAIIMAHNHPSGSPDPSGCDDEITRRIARACSVVGVKLLDHVIVGVGHYSYAEHDNPAILATD